MYRLLFAKYFCSGGRPKDPSGTFFELANANFSSIHSTIRNVLAHYSSDKNFHVTKHYLYRVKRFCRVQIIILSIFDDIFFMFSLYYYIYFIPTFELEKGRILVLCVNVCVDVPVVPVLPPPQLW